MKQIFKSILLFLFLTKLSYARDIIYIENQASKGELLMLVKILEKKFNMPSSFITKRDITGDCKINTDSIMHLCLKQDGSLEVLKIESYVIDGMLRTFIEMEK